MLGLLFNLGSVYAQSYAYPEDGGTGTTTLPAAGQVLIGFDGDIYGPAWLTAGANIIISTSSGGITIESSGGAAGSSQWSTSTGMIYYNSGDVVIGSNATITAPFWFDYTNDILHLSELNMEGDLLPATTAIYDLGNSSYVWKDVYGTTFYGDGSNLTDVGAAAASALTASCKVNEGAGISKGQCVYISGATGNMAQVSLCNNTVNGKHSFFGLAAETQADGQNILIRKAGELTNVDTDGTGVPGTSENWNDGDCLFMSTNGNLTNIKPTSGTVHKVGQVTQANGSTGRIEVVSHEGAYITVPLSEIPFIRMGGDTATSTADFRNYSNATYLTIDALGNLAATGTITAGGDITGANLNISNWDNAYTGWNASNSNWDLGYSGYVIVNASSSGWDVAEGLVTANHSNWTSAYDIVNASSSSWDVTQGIVSASSSNWDEAYGWGDWSEEGFLTAETDPVWIAASSSFVLWASASTTNWDNTQGIVSASSSNWDIAHGWGNHGDVGYLETELDPIWIAASSSFILWEAASTTNWDAAYGWGDHSGEGYLTVETDPVWIAASSSYVLWAAASTSAWDVAEGIVTANNANWTAAYNIVNASSSNWDVAQGLVAANNTNWTSAYDIVNASSSNWDAAFGWGDWSGEGFLTTITPEDLTVANATTDEYVLSYETTGNTFEWVAAGTGDITDVYNCNTGDCSAIVMGAGDSLVCDGGSIELPQDDTTDAVGEMQLDTTDTTFIIHDGTANRVFGDDIYQMNFTIYADASWDAEAVPIWQAPKDMAVTIVQIDAAVMPNTGDTLAFNVEERAWASLNSAGTDIMAELTADASGESTTTFSNAGIAARAHLVFTTGASAASGTDAITGTIYYRKNVE